MEYEKKANNSLRITNTQSYLSRDNSIVDNIVQSVSYQYTNNDDLVDSQIYSNGIIKNFSYDKMGRMTKIVETGETLTDAVNNAKSQEKTFIKVNMQYVLK